MPFANEHANDATHDQAWKRTIELLEQIAADRGMLAQLPEAWKQRLLAATGKIAHPGRAARRQLTQALRQQRQAEIRQKKSHDRQLLAHTGIRSQSSSTRRMQHAHPTSPMSIAGPTLTTHDCEGRGDPNRRPDSEPTTESPRVTLPRNCYICKSDYRQLHDFYDALCPTCADLNWSKRYQTVDLAGRFAILTGGRVKIGFQTALKLLRAGAHTIVTTRFPRDATQRFLAEPDAEAWIDRLELFGLDLRHTPSVESFCRYLLEKLSRLDFIINNACQTVRRPPIYYRHLMQAERALTPELGRNARRMLAAYEQLRNSGEAAGVKLPAKVSDSLAGIQKAAELSQIPLVAEDYQLDQELFPEGTYDQDQQQIDLREVNSWRLPLADVPTVELLEVHLVNAVAPFILNARLKPLMRRVATADKHIVNVSAMEGVFYRAFKTDKHPHTNMAKAALNMMTRTSAQDYATDGIFMNSVDTGWITDEDPADISERKRHEFDFHPPLDQIDAAARILDPIFHGLLTGEHVWGKFLKDYSVANW